MAYTNSSLVVHTNLSPNHSRQRTQPISKITIHHMAGNASIEVCGQIFEDPNSGASSNYGVGTDGRVGQYVEEKNRSWASSSNWNDQRAVTIEVANSKYGGNWPVSDKALKSLINLCVDICKRNGMKKVNFTGDKDGIITLHNMYAATACPGPYLESKMSYIVDQVNAKLSGTSTPAKKPAANKKVAMPTVTYRVRVDGNWLPAVTDLNDYAGIPGKPITDVAIKVSKGKVKYRVHVKGGGWLGWITKYDIKDYLEGYAGNGKPIDAIQVYYYTPDDVKKEYGYLQAKYHISPTTASKYWGWQYDTDTDNGQDGYAGYFGVTIDQLQIDLA